jgi:hypothetical protein
VGATGLAGGASADDDCREDAGSDLSGIGSGFCGEGIGSGFFAISSGVTRSTAIGSAVTVPNPCTSLNNSTSASTDR